MAVQEHDPKQARQKLTVFISYNGMNETFDYTPQQAAQALREHALNAYNVQGPERQENILFGPDNQTEINLGESIGSRVQPGSQLYLRRRVAAGG